MGAGRLSHKLRAWLRRHSYSFFSSLGVLFLHRAGTLMTVIVLGIAMFLPLGLYTTLANLEGMDLRQEEWSAVTIYFRSGASRDEVSNVGSALEQRFQPAAIVTISPEEGLRDFREASGFGESLDMLEQNPLPWVMQVSPQRGPAGDLEARVGEMIAYLQSLENVEVAQFDYKWLQRLGRMMELAAAVVTVLALLFGLAVVVVVANTIRLDVATRAEEIEILALVGAGNAFIRQPFLYTGLWYGLMGGLLAVLLVEATVLYLGQPLGLLLETYGSVPDLHGLDLRGALWVLLAGSVLGWLGAWISVQRYLRMLKVGGQLGRR